MNPYLKPDYFLKKGEIRFFEEKCSIFCRFLLFIHFLKIFSRETFRRGLNNYIFDKKFYHLAV